MKEAIEKKIAEFSACRPENPELLQWLHSSDVWMSAYTLLRISGKEVDKRKLVEVLEGKILEDLPIDLYGFVHRYHAVYKDMKDCLVMQSSLDTKLLNRWYEMLYDAEEPFLRRNNPIIYSWGYIAPHCGEVPGMMEDLFRSCYKDKTSDPAEKAFHVYLSIAGIYPYGEETAQMAFIAMYYILMEAGLPLPEIDISRRDYDALMSDFFKTKAPEKLASLFYTNIYNRLNSVVAFCRAAESGPEAAKGKNNADH